MSAPLPFKVECKSTLAFFELIAAFNCKGPAIWYAKECAKTNPDFTYRVKQGSKAIAKWGAGDEE